MAEETEGGGDFAALVAELRAALTGAWIRRVAGIRDTGEVVLALVKDLAGGDVLAAAEDASDLWVQFAEKMSGHGGAASLFSPLNVLWRKPGAGEHVTILKPAGADGPGAPLALWGEGGAADAVPTRLTDSNTVLSPPTGDLLAESRDGNAQLDAPTSGKKVLLGAGGAAAAREGDQVKVYIPANTVVVAVSGGAAVMNSAPIECDGTITAGSSKVEVE